MHQDALDAIRDHTGSACDASLMGFLVGELFLCPEIEAPYVVIDGVFACRSPIENDDAMGLAHRTWDRLLKELHARRTHLIGWYRTHPAGDASMSPADVTFHEEWFREEWHVAVVLRPDPLCSAGGIYRQVRGHPWSSSPISFHELLPEAPRRGTGGKRSRFTWKNYRTNELLLAAAPVDDCRPADEKPSSPGGGTVKVAESLSLARSEPIAPQPALAHGGLAVARAEAPPLRSAVPPGPGPKHARAAHHGGVGKGLPPRRGFGRSAWRRRGLAVLIAVIASTGAWTVTGAFKGGTATGAAAFDDDGRRQEEAWRAGVGGPPPTRPAVSPRRDSALAVGIWLVLGVVVLGLALAERYGPGRRDAGPAARPPGPSIGEFVLAVTSRDECGRPLRVLTIEVLNAAAGRPPGKGRRSGSVSGGSPRTGSATAARRSIS